MRFFTSHSQKMKNDRLVWLQDKFTDIGPEVFSGFRAEYIILSEKTEIIRTLAFSGIGNCKVYLPRSISEIEPDAFKNVPVNAVFYCVENSYAAQVCRDYNLNICYDVNEFFNVVKREKEKAAEEKAQIEIEAKMRLEAEERERREAEEKARKEAEERARRETEEKAKQAAAEKAEKEAAEQERRRAEEEKARQTAAEKANKEAEEKMRREIEGKVRRELEEKIRRELEEKIRSEIEEKVRRELEEKIRRELEEKIRQDTEEKSNAAENTENLSDSITIYLFDEKRGETKKTVPRKDFPSGALGYVNDRKVYVYKTYKGGTEVNTFVSQTEYDSIKAFSDKKADNGTENGGNPAPENKPQTKQCPFCGGVINMDDKFCVYCGKYIQKVKICPQCGRTCAMDDKFCTSCGKRFD